MVKTLYRISLPLWLCVILFTSCTGQTAQSTTTTQEKETTTVTTPFGDTSVQPTAITVVATPSAVTTTGTAMQTTPTIVTATTAKTTKVTEKAVTAPNAQTTAPPPKEDDIIYVLYAAITGEKPSNTFDEFIGRFIEDNVLRDMVYTCAMNAIKTYYPL